MDLSEYLSRQGTTLDEFHRAARRACGAGPADTLFLGGSMTEGLGTRTSDLDVYLVPGSGSDQRPHRSHPLRIGKTLVDVTTLERSFLDSLIARFRTWSASPPGPGAAGGFSRMDRGFLHRLLHAIPLGNEESLERLRSGIDAEGLARLRLYHALNASKGLSIDLVGLSEEGHWPTMLLVGQELLGVTIDAVLGAWRQTNPSYKWRARLLERLPDDWGSSLPGPRRDEPAVELFLRLGRLPEVTDAEHALAYCRDVVAFSRAVLPWGAWALEQSEWPRTGPFSRAPSSGSPPAMPPLELDVLLGYGRGHCAARRLCGDGTTLELSTLALSALCAFDGRTPEGAVLELLARGSDDPRAELAALRSEVARAGFLARPRVDEERLAMLLRRPSAPDPRP